MGIRPWELIRYTWADVSKTLLGNTQKDVGLRRAAYIIHCSLVGGKDRTDIMKIWPMPFDEEQQKSVNLFDILKQRRLAKQHG